VLTSSYRALDELVERCAGRLQFPVLKQGDAPRERLLERFRDDVGSILFATSTFWQGVDIQGESLSLPAAVLQLRQGFGRLIRGHADEGVVAILDPRLRSRAYGRRFLEALPPAPVVAELSSVADFFGSQARATA
jgi:ATP-dependent DNA helicase DinG